MQTEDSVSRCHVGALTVQANWQYACKKLQQLFVLARPSLKDTQRDVREKQATSCKGHNSQIQVAKAAAIANHAGQIF